MWTLISTPNTANLYVTARAVLEFEIGKGIAKDGQMFWLQMMNMSRELHCKEL